jgi:hypothetical protein
MNDSPTFTIHIEQEQGFDFRVKFDWPDNPDLLLDEPEPLSKRHGPGRALNLMGWLPDVPKQHASRCIGMSREF